MRPRVISGIGWLLALAGLIDAAGRQLIRRSVFEVVLGQVDVSPWWAALVALIGGVLIVSTTPIARGRARSAAVLLTLFVAGIATQLHLGARLQSDGFYYYAFTRSMWFDRDLNLTNDYALLGIDDPQHQFLLEPTVTGYAQSAWAIGPAIAWMPFVGVGHITAHVLASQGQDVKTDGCSTASSVFGGRIVWRASSPTPPWPRWPSARLAAAPLCSGTSCASRR
jgi:hypothetical protein